MSLGNSDHEVEVPRNSGLTWLRISMKFGSRNLLDDRGFRFEVSSQDRDTDRVANRHQVCAEMSRYLLHVQ